MIAVIIPCYRSKDHVLSVLNEIGDEVSEIIVVDDACPESTGDFVRKNFVDRRLKVLIHEKNLGVGGAVKTGFAAALCGECDVFVKMDSDGQMPPSMIPLLTRLVINGESDYCKGNRFYELGYLKKMPRARVIGNAALSFLTKLSTGYWNIMDPTNGFLAINRNIIQNIPLEKIDNRFFFETDLLFRVNTIGALVVDIPMPAVYGGETSNLSVTRSAVEFFIKNLKLFFKRVFYNYFLRDFNVTSLNLVLGTLLSVMGVAYGLTEHLHYKSLGIVTPTGVQISVLIMLFMGFQLLLSFISLDISSVPKRPVSKLLPINKID